MICGKHDEHDRYCTTNSRYLSNLHQRHCCPSSSGANDDVPIIVEAYQHSLSDIFDTCVNPQIASGLS